MKVTQYGKLRTVKVSSSAGAKMIKRYDETGSREDRHRKGRTRIASAAEDRFISCQPQKLQPKKMLQSSSNRHMSTSTVQRRLHESGLHG
jgi:transposase